MGRSNITSNLFGITLFTGEVVFTSKKEYCIDILLSVVHFDGFVASQGNAIFIVVRKSLKWVLKHQFLHHEFVTSFSYLKTECLRTSSVAHCTRL